MNSLQASWLGSWRVPWELGRGRRWGDPLWALTAIAQAWMLGGREGRWPRAQWEAKRPHGPRIASVSGVWTSRPDPSWISLLRHGSPEVPARERGIREDELQAWCWEALIEGDGGPWMAFGAVLLDRPTRTRWMPLLAAVDADGGLLLPSFLEPLVPGALRRLPEGWWACLLGSMDAQGHLVPEGTFPEGVPRSWFDPGMRDLLDPLILDTEEASRLGMQWEPWAHRIEDGWVLDPRVRAWARGHGASPEALGALVPPSLALGDPPRSMEAEILSMRSPGFSALPIGWEAPLEADLEERPRPEPPPPSGDPVLDRIRVRWCLELPPQTPGYPSWGEVLQACCDPFHWMAEGQRAFRSQELEAALRAFSWAHAHFTRLKSPKWAERAAANAEASALYWGGLSISEAWRKKLGPQPSPFRELSEAVAFVMRDEWDKAEPILMALMKSYPEFQQPWLILAQRGMEIGREDWVQMALQHLEPGQMCMVLKAFLDGMMSGVPTDLSPEIRILWELHRILRAHVDSGPFWKAWLVCPNGPLRLGTALDLMEACPAERTPGRLLELQVLADRLGAPRVTERLRALWPVPALDRDPEPASIVRANLGRLGRPAWVLWEGPDGESLDGVGEAPPPGAFAALKALGSLPPTATGEWVWRGFPLGWKGAVVAWALVAFKLEEAVPSCEEILLLAPWLVPSKPLMEAPVDPVEGELLTDGSEPMGSLMRELAQVADSSLPVLILGPTGSGKELVAREVHRRSGRGGPMVPVNVTAFAEGVLESELFGHVRGAFTGADRDRKGAIEAAEGGTLFLDEVADLSPRLQSMLLRVLQDRMVRRVGSDKSRMVDVRFIAATHKSLEDLVDAGTFRRDLLFRLQGAVLRCPSLRDRRHEFPYLFPRIVGQVARESGIRCPGIAPGLAQVLSGLNWPGNFRELRHSIQRGLLRCGEGPLQPEHFPEREATGPPIGSWEECTREFQRKLLMETLRQHQFQVTDAARTLGLTRPALYQAAKRLGVDLAAERVKRDGKG